MSNDPTTTPTGESDMTLKSSRGRSNSRSSTPYPGMMGDGTEEQNLNQPGNPSARIGEDEVDQAFAGSSMAAGASREPRSFMDKTLDKDAAMQMADKAKDAAAEKLSALTDKVNSMRDQVQQSADAARDWAMKRADAAASGAKQLQEDKPMLVLSVSAGAALAVGLLAGFIVGRATADEY